MASNSSALRSASTPSDLARPLLDWFRQYGRHDLPWQQPRSAYRVWVSEIMLQQTQVNTVVPYFERFMQRFPDINSLADADIDDVLHQWTGLGYYARARNLHKAAQQIRDQHNGHFPDEFDDITNLPGIGRSTAGAILAQAYGKRFAILDGNVKRVLTRLYLIEGWPGSKAVENRLWEIAEACTPGEDIVDYTQAIMDLGATVCKRTRPDCDHCPFAGICEARAQSRQTDFPYSKPKKDKPVKTTGMLIIVDAKTGHVLLEQRPPSGIWGGLWSFPECRTDEDIEKWCKANHGLQVTQAEKLAEFRHTFSHYHLDIHPIRVTTIPATAQGTIMDSDRYFWYNTRQPDARGLPAPIKTLLANLGQSD